MKWYGQPLCCVKPLGIKWGVQMSDIDNNKYYMGGFETPEAAGEYYQQQLRIKMAIAVERYAIKGRTASLLLSL